MKLAWMATRRHDVKLKSNPGGGPSRPIHDLLNFPILIPRDKPQRAQHETRRPRRASRVHSLIRVQALVLDAFATGNEI